MFLDASSKDFCNDEDVTKMYTFLDRTRVLSTLVQNAYELLLVVSTDTVQMLNRTSTVRLRIAFMNSRNPLI